MIITGRPLLDTENDAALFVNRDRETGLILGALEHGLNCVIHGERGIGKTSLLRRAMYLSRDNNDLSPYGPPDRYDFIVVPSSAATSAAALLAELVTASGADTAFRATSQLAELPVADLLKILQRWAEQRQLNGRHVVVMDGPTAAVANALFGGHRDDLWAIDAQWILITTSAALQETLAPPADAFFEIQVSVGGLPSRAATDLLARRYGEVPANVASYALEVSDGNPRRLLTALRNWMTAGESAVVWTERVEQGRSLQTRILGELGRSAHMAFVELEALGSASASDEEFLRRMGWTRARASQVLTQLESIGLVRSKNVKQDAGRPRRVFIPVPLEEVQDSVATMRRSHHE